MMRQENVSIRQQAEAVFQETVGNLSQDLETLSPGAMRMIFHDLCVNQIEIEMRNEAELRDALDRAESASRAKSEFLAVVSHEIRTPLNGVLGFAELMSHTPLGEEQRDYIQEIKGCAEHLLSIIDDILDFSGIEKGSEFTFLLPLESRPSLCDCERNAKAVLKPSLPSDEKGARLVVDEDRPNSILGGRVDQTPASPNNIISGNEPFISSASNGAK